MTTRGKRILISLAVFLIGGVMAALLVVVVLFPWVSAERAGNEAATIQNLKTIGAVEAQYSNNHKRKFASFEQLVSEQFLNTKFKGNPVTLDGYVLSLTMTSDAAAYAVNADPFSPRSGTDHFYLDSASGQIHVNPDRPADAKDPLLDR